MSLFSTKTLMDRLYGCFDSIFKHWLKNAPHDSHLWEITQNSTALAIVEQDIIDIGGFFSSADNIAERSETFLTAELIAHVRVLAGQASPARREDDLAQEIGDWLLLHPGRTFNQQETIYTPLCYRIAQFAHARGMISEAALDMLRQTLLDLAHHFLLHDGNITPQEDHRMKEFYDALS